MEENINKNIEKEPDGYMSLSEAAKASGYTRGYLNMRCRQGLLMGKKIGRNWYTKKEWLNEYVKSSDYISLSEAAKLSGYTRGYLNMRSRQGLLKSEKIGRNRFTKKEWLEEFTKGIETNGKGGGINFKKEVETKHAKIKSINYKKENNIIIPKQPEEINKINGVKKYSQDNYKVLYQAEKNLILDPAILEKIIENEKEHHDKFYSWKNIQKFSFGLAAIILVMISTAIIFGINSKNNLSNLFINNQTQNIPSSGQVAGEIKLAEGTASEKVLGEAIKKITPGMDVLAQVAKPDGTDLEEGDYEVRFALYNMDRLEADPYPSNSDTSVWNETQTVHIKNGVLNTRLGTATPFPKTFDPGNNELYLGVRIGQNSEMVPRKKINVAPLSLYAYSAANANSINGATTGTGAGNILVLGAGGKVNIANLPTGTSGNTLVLSSDPRLTQTATTTKLSVSGASYISVSGTKITLNQIDLTSDVTGILPIANGGTGLGSYAAGDMAYYSSGTALSKIAIGNEGQVLTITGGVPAWADGAGAHNPVTLAGAYDYLTLSGQQITLGQIDLSTDVSGNLDISSHTNLAVGGTILQLTGDTLSLREGSLDNGKLCTYVSGTGLVCNTDSASVGHTPATLAGQNYLSIDGNQQITGQPDKFDD